MKDHKGYVYEYGPRYTVICSTFCKPFTEDEREYYTSYTIVHWNPSVSRNDRRDKIAELQAQINVINVRITSLETACSRIGALKDQIQLEGEMDYFVPGIVEDDDDTTVGGYLVKKPNAYQKSMIQIHWKKLFQQIKPQLQHGNIKFDNTDELRKMVIDHFSDVDENGRKKRVAAFPGYFGQLLKKIMIEDSYKHLRPHVLEWKKNWISFLDKQGV
jgi:hypothetical protein